MGPRGRAVARPTSEHVRHVQIPVGRQRTQVPSRERIPTSLQLEPRLLRPTLLPRSGK